MINKTAFLFRSAITVALLLIAAMTFAAPVVAQDAYADITDSLAQGQEIFRKSIQAFGGPKRLSATKSITHRLTVELTRADGEYVQIQDSVIQVFPDREARYTRADSSDEVLWVVLNGDDVWRVRNGDLEEMTRPQVIVQRKSFEGAMFNLLTTFDRPHYEVRFAGTEDIDNAPVLRLNFKTTSGYEFSWFVNPETYLPSAVSIALDRTKGMYFMDVFEEIDGVQVCTATRLVRNGRTIRIVTDDIAFNAPYDTSIFTRP